MIKTRKDFELWWKLQAENVRMGAALEKFRDPDSWLKWGMNISSRPGGSITYSWIDEESPIEVARKALEGK